MVWYLLNGLHTRGTVLLRRTHGPVRKKTKTMDNKENIVKSSTYHLYSLHQPALKFRLGSVPMHGDPGLLERVFLHILFCRFQLQEKH